MSATNDVSRSEDSANSLLDRSMLDPAWRAPRLECVSAEELASRADQFEILVVRPGVRDADALPRDFKDQA